MKSLALQKVGSNKHGEILDFVVSGRSLYRELVSRGYDLIPRTGPLLVPTDVTTRELLLLERDGDTPRGRVALYFCPLCGDLACGAVSVRILRDASAITWVDFAIEYDGFEEDEDTFQILPRLGPYKFDEVQYAAALAG